MRARSQGTRARQCTENKSTQDRSGCGRDILSHVRGGVPINLTNAEARESDWREGGTTGSGVDWRGVPVRILLSGKPKAREIILDPQKPSALLCRASLDRAGCFASGRRRACFNSCPLFSCLAMR